MASHELTKNQGFGDALDLLKATPEHDLIARRLSKGAGEGTRGGKVVGHTGSGKPIYSSHDHSAHSSFSAQDHRDAWQAHTQASDAAYAKRDVDAHIHHVVQADKHDRTARGGSMEHVGYHPGPSRAKKYEWAVEKSVDDSDLSKGAGEGTRGGHVIGHTGGGKPIYASKGAKEFKAHTKGYTKQDHKDAEARHSSIAEQSRGTAGGPNPEHLQSARAYNMEMSSAHSAAVRRAIVYQAANSTDSQAHKQAQQSQDVAADRASHHHHAEVKRHASRKISGDSPLPVGFEGHGFGKAMDNDSDLSKGAGEGTRGGHVIGHTSSGKPIYESTSYTPTTDKHTHSDHEEAHRKLLREASGEQHTHSQEMLYVEARKHKIEERKKLGYSETEAKETAHREMREHHEFHARNSPEGSPAHKYHTEAAEDHAEEHGKWWNVNRQKAGYTRDTAGKKYSQGAFSAGDHPGPGVKPLSGHKSMDNDSDLHKGAGEGTRGGKVIGHTGSGKPIYASKHEGKGHFHKKHQSYTRRDHFDAAKLHEKHAQQSAIDVAKVKQNIKDSGGPGSVKTPTAQQAKLRKEWSKHLAKKVYHSGMAGAHRSQAEAEISIAPEGHIQRQEHTANAFAESAGRQHGEAFGKSEADNSDLQKAIVGWDAAVERLEKAGGGPFIGPRKGKWADAKHTIPWKEGKTPSRQRKHAHAGSVKGWHSDHKGTTSEGHSDLAERHNDLAYQAATQSDVAGHRYHMEMAGAHRQAQHGMEYGSSGKLNEYDKRRIKDHLTEAQRHMSVDASPDTDKAKAVEEPQGFLAGQSWTSLMDAYDKNEDRNNHSENHTMLAEAFGLPKQAMDELLALKRKTDKGDLTLEDSHRQVELTGGLWGIATEKADKEKAAIANKPKGKHTYRIDSHEGWGEHKGHYETAAELNAALKKIGSGEHPSGGYAKTRVMVMKDGEDYHQARLDVQHDGTDSDIAEHFQQAGNFYSSERGRKYHAASGKFSGHDTPEEAASHYHDLAENARGEPANDEPIQSQQIERRVKLHGKHLAGEAKAKASGDEAGAARHRATADEHASVLQAMGHGHRVSGGSSHTVGNSVRVQHRDPISENNRMRGGHQGTVESIEGDKHIVRFHDGTRVQYSAEEIKDLGKSIDDNSDLQKAIVGWDDAVKSVTR